MSAFKVIDQRISNLARCGRVIVSLLDGRSVVADYLADAHRLEIRFEGHCIIRGATSWCNAVLWGNEFKTGREVQRVAEEVERYMSRDGMKS